MDTEELERLREAFASELRAARGRAAMSRTEVARKSGVSLSSLNRYESGERTIPLPDLVDICRVLDVPVEQIFDAAQRAFRDSTPGAM